MNYQIHHKTIYRYNQPVFLKPHTLRLRPRCDSQQQLLNFSLTLDPQPIGISQIIDLDGNNVVKVWFTEATEQLSITIEAEVKTALTNPFNYLLEPWATKLPIDYPSSILNQLQPYFKPYSLALPTPIIEFAHDILDETQGNPLNFLLTLNQRLYQTFEYIVRETGDPWQPIMTWKQKKASCRDLTVLFMDICRVVGLGTRFVSGYQEGDRDQEQRDLHAWVEVYLPGGGWRGYDPTYGLAAGEGHIVLAASPMPQKTAPVSGHIAPVDTFSRDVVQSIIEVNLLLERSGNNNKLTV
ncbi:transglutaminase domain protein [Rippkaea orientalis PCC 8801]|uniref:Transglutaminase domain protein n=1 Tax=Rippkaea orientalis (strain PCC 8801 / RF-1) TaxID=41431 RepID=B7JWK7_RIPO1|nr:transglutaminase domain protein [Rippkaea orientalis PCC 8801]